MYQVPGQGIHGTVTPHSDKIRFTFFKAGLNNLRGMLGIEGKVTFGADL